ncbi:MAG: hypothetical protein H0V66_10470, partial [Bdellovibrionales bacterium]|nr:hypothetical protein [Bdellovibrionales bacterium]
MSLQFLKNTFSEIDPSLPIEISYYEEGEYFDSIFLNNAVPAPGTLERLRSFFGGIDCRIVQTMGVQQSRIDISKVSIGAKALNAKEYVKYMGLNQDKGWFLGLGSFGPEFFDIDRLTHTQVSGSSGYGKSSFFKFLLAQTLAFKPNIVNFIIDPKKIDFPALKGHPQVAMIAHERDEWRSLLSALVTELCVRETVFNEAFTNPPDALHKYWGLKKESAREELPEFPRLIIWIDEFHMIKKSNSDFELDSLEFIARKGRAFGIHLICSSQRGNDISLNIRAQMNSSFHFYESISSPGYY